MSSRRPNVDAPRTRGDGRPELGYAVSSEEHGPDEVVDYAVRAEECGFDFVSVSDHFHS